MKKQTRTQTKENKKEGKRPSTTQQPTDLNENRTPLIKRHFSKESESVYDRIPWETRNCLIGSEENPVFKEEGVEVPAFWSQDATNIVAQKYFAYGQDDPRREKSVRTMIERAINKTANEGENAGYFAEGEKEIFLEELRYIIANQLATFNSPFWFNIGVEGVSQQASACFILDVEDNMESIARWYGEEMTIFKGGSGAGLNLSKLRSAGEALSKGGNASGPVTFMRGADANAGTIKSGGVKRRAAKLVCLDVDHPDVEDFISCKVNEEKRIQILAEAGIDMGFGEEGEKNLAESTAYQNANNSVRVTDEFMEAVEADGEWNLKAVTTGETVRTVKARDIMKQIAEAAWLCADPGIQYDTTINDWHTTPSYGRIEGSNPCSEYMSNSNTACNLASLNLKKFFNEKGEFLLEDFLQTVRVIFTAQEITIGFADFPTNKITKRTAALRQIGLGYSNLGALLMSQGLAYDSDEGRALAAAITSLLSATAYEQSAVLAKQVGPFAGYQANEEPLLRVLKNHGKEANALADRSKDFQALPEIENITTASQKLWRKALREAKETGVRNSQVSVLAPCGTISFFMDCDTTGIEPDFALIKHKILAGGGSMDIVNQSLKEGLVSLGYNPEQVKDIEAFVSENDESGHPRNSVINAPHLRREHYPVFDTAVGASEVSPIAHVRMVAAVQPFLSGAVSKTVNIPASYTPDDIMDIYIKAWEMKTKSISIYRDGSKSNQPLTVKKNDSNKASASAEPQEAVIEGVIPEHMLRGRRREVPRNAQIAGVDFEIGQTGGYIHVRLFEDGTPGAIFLDVGQAGSTLHGFIRAWSVTMSLALQYGMPLDHLVRKLAWTQFEPAGITNDPEIRIARSIVDYVVRWLAREFLDPSAFEPLGIRPIETKEIATDSEQEKEKLETSSSEIEPKISIHASTKPAASFQESEQQASIEDSSSVQFCIECGGTSIRTGACFTCTNCGSTGGCG